jgi:hypothetical protein
VPSERRAYALGDAEEPEEELEPEAKGPGRSARRASSDAGRVAGRVMGEEVMYTASSVRKTSSATEQSRHSHTRGALFCGESVLVWMDGKEID